MLDGEKEGKVLRLSNAEVSVAIREYVDKHVNPGMLKKGREPFPSWAWLEIVIDEPPPHEKGMVALKALFGKDPEKDDE